MEKFFYISSRLGDNRREFLSIMDVLHAYHFPISIFRGRSKSRQVSSSAND